MSIKVRYTPEIVKPKKAVIYLRVSTEEQVDNFSLGTQEEICRKEAVRRGFEIIKIALTVVSARFLDACFRPYIIYADGYCRENDRPVASAVRVTRVGTASTGLIFPRRWHR